MKTITVYLVLGLSVIFLIGCGGNKDATSNILTPTPFLIHITATLTNTPLENRSVATPSPTTNTAWVTAAPTSKCPQENPNLTPTFELSEDPRVDMEQPILEFLNSSGSPVILINQLFSEQVDDFFFAKYALLQDLTEDNIPELVIGYRYFRIYTCQDGNYQKILEIEPNMDMRAPSIASIEDMNVNGVPEIFLQNPSGGTTDRVVYQIWEWNGQQFQNLVLQADYRSRYFGNGVYAGSIFTDGHGYLPGGIAANWEIKDRDNDETLELIFQGGIAMNPGVFIPFGPWRVETAVYKWNGIGFVLDGTEIEAPQYRFQAVQGADYAFLDGNYDKAIELYQKVIFDEQLDWWSFERALHNMDVAQAQVSNDPTPTPLPVDTTEYYNLAAYARFRMMLTYLIQEEFAEAETIYYALQEDFPEGQTGYSYAEMAKDFWVEYQNTFNFGSACSKAINYATQHPYEILVNVGDIKSDIDIGNHDYVGHGFQSRVYNPEDICPLK